MFVCVLCVWLQVYMGSLPFGMESSEIQKWLESKVRPLMMLRWCSIDTTYRACSVEG